MEMKQLREFWYRTFRYQFRYTANNAWKMAIDQSKYGVSAGRVTYLSGWMNVEA